MPELPRLAAHIRPLTVAFGIGYAVLAALLVFLRGRPSVESDAGIFLSVAGRLLQGDRLYAGVFDNKDPLIYYLYAGAAALGDWRVPFLLDIAWLAVAAGSTALLVLRLGCRPATALAASIVYPLLLTGSYYHAGYTMLPALALVPAIAIVSLGYPAWSGALIGLALMLKINLALVLVAPVIALWLTDNRPRSLRRSLARAVGGVAVAFSSIGLILAARGELRAYLATLAENVDYANSVLPTLGRRGGLLGHVATVYHELDHRWIVLALFALGGFVAARHLVTTRRARASLDPGGRLAALFLATSGAVGVTLATTAVWDEHLQMIALPATFLLAFAAERLIDGHLRLVGASVVTMGTVAALGAFSASPDQNKPLDEWLVRSPSGTAVALTRSRGLYIADRESVSYFHLGANDEQGHAAFLDPGFVLSCRRFHQYEWSDHTEVLTCLSESKPDVIFTTPSFRTLGGPRVAWDRFVKAGRDYVSTRYRRVLANRDAEVWIRLDLAGRRSRLSATHSPSA